MRLLDRLVVATDSDEVAEVCRGAGAETLLTSPSHPTGSDRVWEVTRHLGGSYDVIVNIQGDEPLVGADAVKAAIAMVERGFDAGTCAAPVRDEEEFRDPAVVKVVRTREGRALYFSRAAIPYGRDRTGERSRLQPDRRLRHVGIYAYGPEALRRWVGFSRSPLERLEDLEQLRALENGMRIGVALVAEAAEGVDTPHDLERMEHRLRRGGVTEA